MTEKGQLLECHCTTLKANSTYKQRQKPCFIREPRILRVQYAWVLDTTQRDGGTVRV
jgi:hypothetical protein